MDAPDEVLEKEKYNVKDNEVMKQVRVVLTCDEGFVAETMRDIATMIEDEEQSWYEAEHGSGFTEEIEVPDPEPSLADVFDKKAKETADKREAQRQKLIKMDAEEREYIDALAEKLDFLRDRGFTLNKYFGGIVDGRPYNYLNIISKRGRNIAINGSSVRRDSGLNVVAFYFANYQHPTLEEVIKVIAEW